MSRLISTVFAFRRDPRFLKLPPYLSLLCVIVGIAWLFLLPLNDYSRRTYISENALLPGQVRTHFSGSDQNVFRAYKHEIAALEDSTNAEINDYIEGIFKGFGLKVGRQNFTYDSAGTEYSGENIYAILQAPRGDATEAIVLVAPWRNLAGDFNRMGVPVSLALMRYFKRWSLWSKDIILVVPPDSKTGTQAWVDAYHDAHNPATVSSLPLKSGALQGAIAVDYAVDKKFKSMHIVYDGINGQLPNLDLINAVVSISNGQHMQSGIQEMWNLKQNDKYNNRLQTMLRGMLKQGLGYAHGAHSSFIPYHVDAVTLQPFGEGWQDEMALGRIVEGSFRSLNNLLEHLHQSFFFYLLVNKDRFVSIGTYLPSAMILAANFSIMAIFYWVKSGASGQDVFAAAAASPAVKAGSSPAAPASPPTVERALALPIGVVVLCHFLGAIPLFVFNNVTESLLVPLFIAFLGLNTILPFALSYLLTSNSATLQQFHLVKCFSLLLLGLFLSALATLNFSLSFLVGLLASPLTFIKPLTGNDALRYASAAFLQVISPAAVIYTAAMYTGFDIGYVLKEAAFGWDVWGMYTPVVIWGVWWPAWLAASALALGKPASSKS